MWIQVVDDELSKSATTGGQWMGPLTCPTYLYGAQTLLLTPTRGSSSTLGFLKIRGR